jgi:hypothetical protein
MLIDVSRSPHEEIVMTGGTVTVTVTVIVTGTGTEIESVTVGPIVDDLAPHIEAQEEAVARVK